MARFRFRLQPLLDDARREVDASTFRCKAVAARIGTLDAALRGAAAPDAFEVSGHSVPVWRLHEAARLERCAERRCRELRAALELERRALTAARAAAETALLRRNALKALRSRRLAAHRQARVAREEAAFEVERDLRRGFERRSCEAWSA
ncbi:MAG: hypothetical protein GIW95_09820 [Candidatus Eremiobacteraeota bacterium]|nr:hypothetical protein [Candidatus Eremiobacteraeota bacterium]